LPETLRGFHFLVFAILMLTRFVTLMGHSAYHALGYRSLTRACT
jgi:hypothetical protein